jgi:hypothetical protein
MKRMMLAEALLVNVLQAELSLTERWMVSNLH